MEKEKKLFCVNCKETNELQDWENATLAQCKNREDRRSYKSLAKTLGRNEELYYMCPNCRKWIYLKIIKVVQ